jgi:RNA polymerase sigma factor (sigma-70 family)
MSGVATGAFLRQIHDLFDGGIIAGQTDGQLLERFLTRRDATAFETLVARHGPLVLRVCRGALRDPADSEDAFQATFLVLVRKAATIRGRDSLGPWLTKVAHRVAVEANAEAMRRRERVRRGGDFWAVAAPRDLFRDEARVVLHEEIARLPEQIRRPLVLCHLEDKTHAQAATEMQVGEATIRRRLGRARDLLRSRLTRRGITASTGVVTAAFEGRAASAAVPAAWTSATVRIGLDLLIGRSTSGPAATLVARVTRTFILTRLGTVAVAVGLGLGTWTAWGLVGAGEVPTKEVPRVAPAVFRPVDRPALAMAEMVDVRGVVLDPRGKPADGARVYVVLPSDGDDGRRTEPVAETTSDADGRFHISVPAARLEAPAADPGWRFAQVVAVAKGAGPGWTSLAKAREGDVTLQLVDDVPLVGRVLDLEGRPVVGAQVVVQRVETVKGGNLTPYLDTIRAGTEDGNGRLIEDHWSGIFPGQPASVTTGKDGRFSLSGFGSERLVELRVAAPAIQVLTFVAMTRAALDVGGPGEKSLGSGAGRVHGATSNVLVRPGRTVTGIVRDKSTHKPIAGMSVGGMGLDGRRVTAADGRFTATGFAKDNSYELVATSLRGEPYFVTCSVLTDTPGLGPIEADLECVRGIPYRLKVTDKVTGRPVVAEVTYFPVYPNLAAKDVPGFAAVDGWGPTGSGYREADGTYTGGVLPGPGALCIKVAGKSYRPACVDPRGFFCAPADPGGKRARALGPGRAANPEDEKYRWYGTRDYITVDSPKIGGTSMSQSQFQGIVLTNAAEGSGPLALEVQLEPDPVHTGTVIGPDGKPLAGTTILGLASAERQASAVQKTAEFRVEGLNPLRPRRLTAFHHDQKLAGFLVVKGDETESYRLQLRPWATLTGRLVDDQGKPRPGVRLLSEDWRDPIDQADNACLPSGLSTDHDGRFRFERVVPGLQYGPVSAEDKRGDDYQYDPIFVGLTLGPGEVRELGDVRAKPAAH